MSKSDMSFILRSHSNAPVWQMTVSKPFMGFISFCLLWTCFGLGAFIYGYTFLKTKVTYHQALRLKVIGQSDQITDQQKNIQIFSQRINKLKFKLMQLSDFENAVREIAKIDKGDVESGSNGLTGVGGAIPDDLNSQIPLTEKHDDLIQEMSKQVAYINNTLNSQKKKTGSFINNMDDDTLEILACAPSIHPCRGRVTSGFGYRESPFKRNKLAFHRGFDIATKVGTPIKATADGVVIFSGYQRDFGRLITIDHGNNITTSYGHAKKLLKKKGNIVKKGDVIAKVGKSGRTTGYHVHYEVHVKGIPVNPEKYFLE
ncbi:M23 family metallopeptidase [Desulfococcaceae bacterium HSG9]|nr:M23 family metallopeptidase [Desulfococcaceae bacterium HSG9]